MPESSLRCRRLRRLDLFRAQQSIHFFATMHCPAPVTKRQLRYQIKIQSEDCDGTGYPNYGSQKITLFASKSPFPDLAEKAILPQCKQLHRPLGANWRTRSTELAAACSRNNVLAYDWSQPTSIIDMPAGARLGRLRRCQAWEFLFIATAVRRMCFDQCRVNANRGPWHWQLFARAPLLTRDKDLSHSQPLE